MLINTLEKWSGFWFDLSRRLPSDLSDELRYSEFFKRLTKWRDLLVTVPKRSAKFCNWLKYNNLTKRSWILACHYVQLQCPMCVALLEDPHAVIPDSKAGEKTRPEWDQLIDVLPSIKANCLSLAHSLEKEAKSSKIKARANRRPVKKAPGKLIETVTEKLSEWQVRMLQQRVVATPPLPGDEEDIGPDPFERIDFEPFTLKENQQRLRACSQPNCCYSYPVILIGHFNQFLLETLQPYEPAPYIRGYWKLQNALLFCSGSNSWESSMQALDPALASNYTLFLNPKYRNKRWYWLAIPSQFPSATIRDWSPVDDNQLAEGQTYEC